MTVSVTVTPDDALRLSESGKRALNVHGSCYVSPYIFGSCRGRGSDSRVGVVRVNQNDYSMYDTAEITHPDYGPNAVQGLEAICHARGKIWLTIQTGSGIAIISVDVSTMAVVIEFETAVTNDAAQWILYDGVDTLYFDSNVRLCRYNLDTDAFTMLDLGAHREAPTTFHSGIMDATHIYMISSTNGDGHAVYCLKVALSPMAFVDRVEVPKCTDDMAITTDWVFAGIEIVTGLTGAFGYGMGTVAVRKSDMASFMLPLLGPTDDADTKSYGAYIYGNALFNLKTNAHTYITDITDPSTWTPSTPPTDVGLFDVTFNMPSEMDNTTSFTAPNFPNELLLDDEGNFHSFCWPTANPFGFDNPVTNDLSSGIVKFTIPGFTPIPIVTEHAASATLLAVASLTGSAILESSVLQPLYPVLNHPLLGQTYIKLAPDAQLSNNVLAELLLNLRAPAYSGNDALELTYAVVAQINFQLEHGLTPEIVKSVSQAHPGNTTSYRDRYVSPVAWHIVSRVTGVQSVAFRPPGFGV